MIATLSVSEINIKQWAYLVDNSPVASFFQTKECYDFYASLSFLEPFVVGISENDKLVGVICGYIIADGGKIKQFFSRRAIIPGGALLDENISDEALQALLETLKKELKNKAIYIEIRNYFDYSKHKQIFENNGFSYNQHLNFQIKTESEEQIYNQLSSTKRRDVKISLKNGCEIIEIKDDKDLYYFYNLLNDLYLTKIKTPLFPFEFFQKIVNLSECKIFGIKHKGQIIGGSVCVFAGKNAVYEWFCCGLDGKFKNIYPSTLSTWAGIEFAAKNGYKYFDMMGAGKPDESYGVREFKAKFGGNLVEHGRFLCVCNSFLYNLGKEAVKFLRK